MVLAASACHIVDTFEIMKTFEVFIRAIYRLFAVFIVFILFVFAGILIYTINPSYFNSDQISADNWKPKDPKAELNAGLMPKDVEYGYKIVTETPAYVGPKASSPNMRYAGNNLTCTNCHLKGGTQAGSASWVGAINRFPQFSSRSNRESSIQDRINGCMQRSMNGKKLPAKSKEMKSIVAYMSWLGEDIPKKREKEFEGFPKLEIPEFAVNLELGKQLFIKECVLCHGANGQGIKYKDTLKGYQYPPLWGSDSFNDGAGMHRVLTAASFIKANMPYEQATWDKPKLTDEEAYHLAGYINSFQRPSKADLDKDYPDLKLKPVSTPYGPWIDDFTAEQHKFGPFIPIIVFYKEQYNLSKNK